MQEYSTIVILQWLYERYLIVFLLCFLGSFIRDVFDTIVSLSKIDIRKILVSTVFCSIIDTAILDNLSMDIGVYVAICVFTGMWSYDIMRYATNFKFILRFLKYFAKSFMGAAGKSFSDTINDLDDDGNLIEKQEEEEDDDKKT